MSSAEANQNRLVYKSSGILIPHELKSIFISGRKKIKNPVINGEELHEKFNAVQLTFYEPWATILEFTNMEEVPDFLGNIKTQKKITVKLPNEVNIEVIDDAPKVFNIVSNSHIISFEFDEFVVI